MDEDTKKELTEMEKRMTAKLEGMATAWDNLLAQQREVIKQQAANPQQLSDTIKNVTSLMNVDPEAEKARLEAILNYAKTAYENTLIIAENDEKIMATLAGIEKKIK